ncbi:Nop domain-containing protein [Jaminaea rosea]|uniref:Nucleolar protein 58 n=1 Tax=Jaminaea rosea TaxID=1569628 RepID=A0A316UX11_9BASI|nr:Nop domain-containing protein [Jaminaea rosea]PWN29829.1 Nop domain-containing protein [Jaminaea rosea]
MVLVLFETAVGLALFRLSDSAKVTSPDLANDLADPTKASNLLKLSAISRFTSTAEAVDEATSIAEGKMTKSLKKLLTDEIVDQEGSKKGKGKNEQLVVVDPKLGGAISKKLGINVISDSSVNDLYRGIRTHLAQLLSSTASDDSSLDPRDLNTMSLGLSHSLSRYKLKFSPDKVDTMVVQAIGLLDDLDKEINIYAMRVKEWYGWHFPEMGKIITDNLAYAKVIRAVGFRTNMASSDLSEILPEEIEETIKAAAEISMGTEISETDIEHIFSLCDQVISITAYRAQLFAYLQNRMAAIAPNLTALVGELVGARLISHAGSLLSLAKQPASTVQILGAEKALFRALKTKHDTPKYGLIFHSSLVGQAPQKLKGKMARMVATKAALSIRLDALADADSKSDAAAPSIGLDARAKLESRLRGLEHRSDIGGLRAAKNGAPSSYQQKKFDMADAGAGAGRSYNAAADAPVVAAPAMDVDESTASAKLSKEERKAAKKAAKAAAAAAADQSTASATVNGDEDGLSKEERKRLKKEKKAAKEAAVATNGKKRPAEDGEDADATAVSVATNGETKKSKKSKKSKD